MYLVTSIVVSAWAAMSASVTSGIGAKKNTTANKEDENRDAEIGPLDALQTCAACLANVLKEYVACENRSNHGSDSLEGLGNIQSRLAPARRTYHTIYVYCK